MYGLLDNTNHDTFALGFSIEPFSVYGILHFFQRSSFLPNNLILLQCLSMLMKVYKGERNPTASWVIFIQCWLLKHSCSGDRCLHLLLILFRNTGPICCHGSLLYQDLSAILVLHPAFLFSHLFSVRDSNHSLSYTKLLHGRNAASSLSACIPARPYPFQLPCNPLGLQSGALWERQHSDLQRSLKSSMKMSAVIGFWKQAPAVCVDSSIFSLFSSVGIREVTLGFFFPTGFSFRYSYSCL